MIVYRKVEMKDIGNTVGRISPEEMAEKVKSWVNSNKEASDGARAKLREMLARAPLHTSLLSELRNEFDIPKPISAWVRLWDEFTYFAGKLDSPNGQPAVALTSEKANPFYWRKFRKSLIPNAEDTVSPWIRLGIPSAATICGPVRMEAFCALLRNINPEGDRWLLMAEVCAEFQKTTGMRFQDFFQGRKPGEVSNDFDGQQYCLWQWSDHRPPLLSVQRKDRTNTAPLQALTATALKALRRVAKMKSPETIDFDGLALKYKVDKDSVYFAYLKEIGAALEPKKFAEPTGAPVALQRGNGDSDESVENKALQQFLVATSDHRRSLPIRQNSISETVTGQVVELKASGAMIDVKGTTAWLPLSEMAWDFVSDPADVVQVGHDYEFAVIPDRDNEGRLIVSLKRKSKDPWLTAASRFAKGTLAEGVVTRYTMNDDGVVVALAPGITGFLPLREMPSQIRKETASASIEKNARVRVVVIGMDREQRKILLGMKQMEDLRAYTGRDGVSNAIDDEQTDALFGMSADEPRLCLNADAVIRGAAKDDLLTTLFGTSSPGIMDVWRILFDDGSLSRDDVYLKTGNLSVERQVSHPNCTFSIIRKNNGERYSVYVAIDNQGSFSHRNRHRILRGGWLDTSEVHGLWHHLADIEDPEISKVIRKRSRLLGSRR